MKTTAAIFATILASTAAVPTTTPDLVMTQFAGTTCAGTAAGAAAIVSNSCATTAAGGSQKLVGPNTPPGPVYNLHVYAAAGCAGTAATVAMAADGYTCAISVSTALPTSTKLMPFASATTAATDLTFGFYSDAACDVPVQATALDTFNYMSGMSGTCVLLPSGAASAKVEYTATMVDIAYYLSGTGAADCGVTGSSAATAVISGVPGSCEELEAAGLVVAKTAGYCPATGDCYIYVFPAGAVMQTAAPTAAPSTAPSPSPTLAGRLISPSVAQKGTVLTASGQASPSSYLCWTSSSSGPLALTATCGAEGVDDVVISLATSSSPGRMCGRPSVLIAEWNDVTQLRVAVVECMAVDVAVGPSTQITITKSTCPPFENAWMSDEVEKDALSSKNLLNPNLNVIWESPIFGDQLRFKCKALDGDQGRMQLDGPFLATCLSDGTWFPPISSTSQVLCQCANEEGWYLSDGSCQLTSCTDGTYLPVNAGTSQALQLLTHSLNSYRYIQCLTNAPRFNALFFTHRGLRHLPSRWCSLHER